MPPPHVGESYKRASFDGTADAIVIGSGIGGLTVAALLAKRAGTRVTVLERHYVAGGYTHTFRRPGYEWDVGLHYIGGAVGESASEVCRLFDDITDGRLRWAPMPDVFDRIIIGETQYDIPSGLERFRARMHAYFPGECAAIDRYITLVQKSVRAMRLAVLDKALPPRVSRLVGGLLRAPFHRYSDRTTREVLEGLTGDRKLIGVLTGQFLNYGLPPAQSSFAIHAVIADHYFDGAYYPIGGASEIARSIAPVIERAGGRILVDAAVEEIVVERGRAVGVRMADGRRIAAPLIVSDAGMPNTFGRLLPASVAHAHGLTDRVCHVRPSTAMVALYLGLKHTDEELGLTGTNLWIHGDYDHDRALAAYLEKPWDTPPITYISFPSAKDPTFGQRYPGKATIEMLAFAPYRWFQQWEGTPWKRRGAEYDALKARFAHHLLAQLERYVPQVRGKVDYWELSTPLSNRHFANHAAGEVYGIDHTPERFREPALRPATPVKQLYLTGCDVLTEGVTAAMYGGYLTASAILNRPLVSARAPRRVWADRRIEGSRGRRAQHSPQLMEDPR
jgi:all-trans-retinol 13,14-reductase